MEEPFFVCVYKKDGMPIGQIVSPENEFPESFEEIKVKSSDGDNIEEKASEFEKIFESYCNSILSYIDMLPFIASISPMVGDAIRSVGLINFLKEKSGKTIETEGRDIFEVPSRFYSDFKEIADSANKASAVGRQIPKMMIIGIVSTYEHHLARLIRKILSSNPDRLTSSDKQVSIKDVFDAKGIDEFKEIVLDKEIDMIMRNSFEEQVSWVEKAIGIRKEIKSEHGDWPKIVELFERRNLFTHTNGIVNDRYLKKSVKLKVSGSSALVKGQELFAGSKYLTSALEIICEFGIKIIQVSWRKLSKEHAKIADDRLGDFGFELIERGNYGLAIKIFEFFFYLEG
ncbi:MAG: hypothetical protein E5X86_09695 [Mesorhizobium sp.]|uniref:hypothetical protein n=1 Tax=Mesorhizobium sp. TaxID=1871066 RepID=UPI001229EF28|nr:hypothetical protein [Mesorhizobium sp.]TIO17999.1 MAG: hypothetical protein E5X86_09695 [Mesorhizobium sp.]